MIDLLTLCRLQIAFNHYWLCDVDLTTICEFLDEINSPARCRPEYWILSILHDKNCFCTMSSWQHVSMTLCPMVDLKINSISKFHFKKDTVFRWVTSSLFLVIQHATIDVLHVIIMIIYTLAHTINWWRRDVKGIAWIKWNAGSSVTRELQPPAPISSHRPRKLRNLLLTTWAASWWSCT